MEWSGRAAEQEDRFVGSEMEDVVLIATAGHGLTPLVLHRRIVEQIENAEGSGREVMELVGGIQIGAGGGQSFRLEQTALPRRHRQSEARAGQLHAGATTIFPELVHAIPVIVFQPCKEIGETSDLPDKPLSWLFGRRPHVQAGQTHSPIENSPRNDRAAIPCDPDQRREPG